MKKYKLKYNTEITAVAQLNLPSYLDSSIFPIISEWVRDVSNDHIRNYDYNADKGECDSMWQVQVDYPIITVFGPAAVPSIEEI